MNDNNSRLRHRNPATESDHAPVDVRNGLIGYECGRCGGEAFRSCPGVIRTRRPKTMLEMRRSRLLDVTEKA